jgi:excisionase family DNA binding protein
MSEQTETYQTNLLESGPVPRTLLSVAESCTSLGVSRSTLYALIRSRRLPARKLGGRTVIAVDDLREMIKKLPDAVGVVGADND